MKPSQAELPPDPLIKKLMGLINNSITHDEAMRLIVLLQNDALPLNASEQCGYAVTELCVGVDEFSVAGPGLLPHDRPTVQRRSDAEQIARCFGRAFAAGQRNRSAALWQLLKP